MDSKEPLHGKNIPKEHSEMLIKIISKLNEDERIEGLAIGGSYINNCMDEFSDLDLIIAVKDNLYVEVMNSRKEIASKLGNLAAAFTGEHVGEPRLLICLYNDPLLHVDLKFVQLSDFKKRVEDPDILLDKNGNLQRELKKSEAAFPLPDLQWIEDRFWVWVHYTAAKIERGELFETIDALSFLRSHVLGPLSLLETGAKPTGVRKIEFAVPLRAEEMQKTVPEYNVNSCILCLYAAIEMYLSLREAIPQDIIFNNAAEKIAMNYLDNIASQFI